MPMKDGSTMEWRHLRQVLHRATVGASDECKRIDFMEHSGCLFVDEREQPVSPDQAQNYSDGAPARNQDPRIARSRSVIPVSLPSGMAVDRTDCDRISGAYD